MSACIFMNKQTILSTIMGLVAGFFIGFVLANSINRNAALQPTAAQNISDGGSLPLNSSGNLPTSGAMMPEIAQIMDKAAKEPDNFKPK